MEADLVDYTEDPFEDHIIFGNPNFIVLVTAPLTVSEPYSLDTSPVVALPSPFIDHLVSAHSLATSPGLEAPPISWYGTASLYFFPSYSIFRSTPTLAL